MLNLVEQTHSIMFHNVVIRCTSNPYYHLELNYSGTCIPVVINVCTSSATSVRPLSLYPLDQNEVRSKSIETRIENNYNYNNNICLKWLVTIDGQPSDCD